MNDINKQKFLAELGRLLTFMYEEDRQSVLAIYGRMFEEAADEQALLQFLVSPTRQAVVLARSYDSKERKLQVHAQSRDEDLDPDDGETPDFVLAIDALKREADAKGLFSGQAEETEEQDVDQISLFEQPLTETAEADDFTLSSYPQDTRDLGFDTPLYEQPAPVKAPREEDFPSPLYAEPEAYEPVEEPDPIVEPAAEHLPAEKQDKVDAFLNDFSIEESDLDGESPAQEKAAPAVRQPVAAPAVKSPAAVEAVEEAQFKYTPPQPVGTVHKARVGLLILFIIIAAPLTLLGVLLLLSLALLFLAAAVGVVSLGVLAFSSVFPGAGYTGFSMLADILVVSGASLVILAVGLFFAWLFVWFIGGAIVGLVRAVFQLGRQWCYKEVEAK